MWLDSPGNVRRQRKLQLYSESRPVICFTVHLFSGTNNMHAVYAKHANDTRRRRKKNLRGCHPPLSPPPPPPFSAIAFISRTGGFLSVGAVIERQREILVWFALFYPLRLTERGNTTTTRPILSGRCFISRCSEVSFPAKTTTTTTTTTTTATEKKVGGGEGKIIKLNVQIVANRQKIAHTPKPSAIIILVFVNLWSICLVGRKKKRFDFAFHLKLWG